MQILININKTNTDLERLKLFELLSKLEEQGYKINSLYGRFIFDLANKEIIDIGEEGKFIPLSMDLVDSIYKTKGCLAVIFTDKKYIVFSNSYFLAVQFCNNRKVKLLTPNDVINNFEDLIVDENKDLLNSLYLD